MLVAPLLGNRPLRKAGHDLVGVLFQEWNFYPRRPRPGRVDLAWVLGIEAVEPWERTLSLRCFITAQSTALLESATFGSLTRHFWRDSSATYGGWRCRRCATYGGLLHGKGYLFEAKFLRFQDPDSHLFEVEIGNFYIAVLSEFFEPALHVPNGVAGLFLDARVGDRSAAQDEAVAPRLPPKKPVV